MSEPVIHLLPGELGVDCPACGGQHRVSLVENDPQRVAVHDACPELRDMLNAAGAVSFSIGFTGKPS